MTCGAMLNMNDIKMVMLAAQSALNTTVFTTIVGLVDVLFVPSSSLHEMVGIDDPVDAFHCIVCVAMDCSCCSRC